MKGRGGRVGSIGSKVADSVFTSYSYRTRPFAKLFTKKKNQCKCCHILIYYIFKVINSLQIKQCLITKKSPSRITRQQDLAMENNQPCGVIIQMTVDTFQRPELNLQFFP